MTSPLCEMCGAEQPRLKSVSVEGTLLMLCDRCARFGVEVQKPRVRPARSPGSRGRFGVMAKPEFDLAADYPERIRNAREALGWKREDLAKKINEKLSVIEKLEKGKMRPDDALVRKLEKTLHVKLLERLETTVQKRSTDRRPLTLGDLIRRQD